MTETTILETTKKQEFIDEKLFKHRSGNFYNKYHFAFENLAREMLFYHYPNYGWFTHFDILAKKLYIFNNCVIPEGEGTWLNVPKIKTCDIFYDKVLDLGASILHSKNLPPIGDLEEIIKLSSEIKLEI